MAILKRILLGMCLIYALNILCGCGKSDAVKNVEALIDGISEVTLDREEEIKEAEDAYAALSEKEKKKVENYEVLIEKREEINLLLKEEEEAKRAEEEARRAEEEARRAEEEARRAEEEEKKRILAKKEEPFLGTWISLYKDIISIDAEKHHYGSFGGDGYEEYDSIRESIKLDDLVISKGSITEAEDSEIKVKGTSYKVKEEEGVTLLIASNGNVYAKEEDYELAFNNRFVKVELDADNIGDYMGSPEYLGKILDQWDDEIADLLILRSKVYDELIMLTYDDVQFEFKYPGGTLTLNEPYQTLYGQGNYSFSGYGRARGEIIFAKSDYVNSITVGPVFSHNGYGVQTRVIEFVDGLVFYFCVSAWPKSTVSYDIRY